MTDGTAARLVNENTLIIEDFPQPGITFRDLTPVFAHGDTLKAMTDAIVAPYAGRIDAVAGVEARGFLLAAAAAYSLGVGIVVIRKPGKLPREVISQAYDLEYGSTALEIQPADLPVGARVLLVDDVLATGGTLAASTNLMERAGWVVEGISVVLELEGLGGREVLAGHDVRSLSIV